MSVDFDHPPAEKEILLSLENLSRQDPSYFPLSFYGVYVAVNEIANKLAV
jgi:hypothetical protein